MNLENRFGDVETNRRDRLHIWLLRIVVTSTATTSLALTCRWRNRPQHHKRTLRSAAKPLDQDAVAKAAVADYQRTLADANPMLVLSPDARFLRTFETGPGAETMRRLCFARPNPGCGVTTKEILR